jgi:hypothetical protein
VEKTGGKKSRATVPLNLNISVKSDFFSSQNSFYNTDLGFLGRVLVVKTAYKSLMSESLQYLYILNITYTISKFQSFGRPKKNVETALFKK